MKCPCCGSEVKGATEELPTYGLSGSEQIIMRTIFNKQAKGRPASIEDIVRELYAHRHDGGPSTPEKTIHVLVHRIRRKLGPVIENTYGGYRLCGKP